MGWQGCALAGGSRGEFISLSFQLLRPPALPGSQTLAPCLSVSLHLSPLLLSPYCFLTLLPPSYKDPRDGVEILSRSKDHLPNSRSLYNPGYNPG